MLSREEDGVANIFNKELDVVDHYVMIVVCRLVRHGCSEVSCSSELTCSDVTGARCTVYLEGEEEESEEWKVESGRDKAEKGEQRK